MTATIHIDMHHEHKKWEAEISQWRDDIAEWQKQLATVESDLDTLKKKLDEHAEVLRKHAGSIRMQEQDIELHEHVIVGYEAGSGGAELLDLAQKHKLEKTRQAQYCEAHAHLKQRHHAILVHWHHLMSALIDAKVEQPHKS